MRSFKESAGRPVQAGSLGVLTGTPRRFGSQAAQTPKQRAGLPRAEEAGHPQRRWTPAGNRAGRTGQPAPARQKRSEKERSQHRHGMRGVLGGVLLGVGGGFRIGSRGSIGGTGGMGSVSGAGGTVGMKRGEFRRPLLATALGTFPAGLWFGFRSCHWICHTPAASHKRPTGFSPPVVQGSPWVVRVPVARSSPVG